MHSQAARIKASLLEWSVRRTWPDLVVHDVIENSSGTRIKHGCTVAAAMDSFQRKFERWEKLEAHIDMFASPNKTTSSELLQKLGAVDFKRFPVLNC